MTIQLQCFFGDDVEEGDNHNDAGGGGENDSDSGDDVVDCNNGGRSDILPLAWSPPTIRFVSSPQTYRCKKKNINTA